MTAYQPSGHPPPRPPVYTITRCVVTRSTRPRPQFALALALLPACATALAKPIANGSKAGEYALREIFAQVQQSRGTQQSRGSLGLHAVSLGFIRALHLTALVPPPPVTDFLGFVHTLSSPNTIQSLTFDPECAILRPLCSQFEAKYERSYASEEERNTKFLVFLSNIEAIAEKNEKLAALGKDQVRSAS